MSEEQKNEMDDFENIFAELAKGDGEPPATQEANTDGTETKTAAEGSQEASTEGQNQQQEASTGGEESEADAEGTADPAGDGSSDAGSDAGSDATDTKPVGEDDEVLRRLAALVKDQRVAPEPAPQVQQQTQQEQPIYSADEQKFLEEYEKDWPDVARAESLRRRSEYRELVNYVFTEVAKVLRPQIETVQAISEMTHLQQLQTQVTDYDDVRDKVIDWANKQPVYLQNAYKHVIEQGTVDEVADLIDRYRQETGYKAPNAAPRPATKRVETELPSATKQAAAALAPVSSKRSAVIAGDDPNDFESAFSSFANKM
jgi:hypothetical protein